MTTNGTTKAYVYDLANQLTAIHQDNELGPVLTNLTYDANGNLETKTTTEGTLTLTYDAWDQMIQAQKPWTFPESYAYDDEGRRITKTVGTNTTDYLYDGLDIVAEYTTTNWATPDALYTHGGGIDSPLIRATQNGAVRTYYHQDGLGSVVAATDELGQAIGTARYDAWGTVARQTGGIPQYGYTGREPDNTGLVYYRARYYDPDTGRFTQPDPVGLAGGTNLYAYAGGDPVNYTDPMGTTPLQVQRILGSRHVASKSYMSSNNTATNNNLSYNQSALKRSVLDGVARDLGISPSMAQNFASELQKKPNKNGQPVRLSNSINVLAGVGGSAIGLTGVEGSVGYVINIGFATNPELRRQGPQTAFFGSVGSGGGINISGDIFVGYIEGNISDVAGQTSNLNFTFSYLSLTLFTDPKTGRTVGGTLGFGPSATGVGISGTYSNTGIQRLD